MNRLSGGLCLVIFAIGGMATAVRAQDSQYELVVGTAGPDCPDATFSRIQDAIDCAPPGADVYVCRGVYPETLLITKPLILDADQDAVLKPQTLLPNGTSLATGQALASLLSVKSTTDVTVNNLTVDADAAGITECSPNLVGVLFQNASGKITELHVRNTKLAPSLSGCQSGLGIFVQSGDGGHSVVEITNNRIEGYQKNGITANEEGTEVEISFNTVTGLGSTEGAAQNGIQVGYGADAMVYRNTVHGNVWAPCVSPEECAYFAAGILIEQAGRIRVFDNDSSHNQVNFAANGNDCKIERNHSYDAVILDGIEILGNGCQVKKNRILDSQRAAIFIAGNDDSVEGNVITDAPIGILRSSTSVGTIIGPNIYDEVGIDIVDPPSSSLGTSASNPVR